MAQVILSGWTLWLVFSFAAIGLFATIGILYDKLNEYFDFSIIWRFLLK